MLCETTAVQINLLVTKRCEYIHRPAAVLNAKRGYNYSYKPIYSLAHLLSTSIGVDVNQ